jgi:uncharacterized protein YfaS (alpha-2-macroglobulin family)
MMSCCKRVCYWPYWTIKTGKLKCRYWCVAYCAVNKMVIGKEHKAICGVVLWLNALTTIWRTSQVQAAAQLGTAQQSFTWPQNPQAPVERVEFNRTQGDINLAWPTQATPLKITHQGEGSPWVRVSTALRAPVTQAQNKGYSISKNMVPIQQKVKGEWHIGDVMRVELSFQSNQEMGWVVVNDPIPAGATLLGRGLKRDSQLLRLRY